MVAGRPEKRFREQDDVPEAYKRLKLEVGKASPSTLATPDQFQTITGPDHAICCNRPFEFATIPLVLLHEAFGIFKDRCLQPPSKAATACLNELAPTACMWYEKETQRRDAVQNVLRKHLRLTFHPEKVPGTEYITGGNLTVVIMPPSVRGCKNEEGNPLNQATLYYSNFLKYAFDRPENFYNFDTRFPCILIVDMGMSAPSSTGSHLLMIYSGSYLAFYGALWDGDRVRVEPLTPSFDLTTHWRESKTRDTMASSFDALVLAVENIQAHYDKIEAEAHVNPAPKPYNRQLQRALNFPFLTSYVDSNSGQKTSFTYVERLDEGKLVFSAFVNDNQQANCIVKFTQQYLEAAHLFLQSYNSAPTLQHCIRISAEWTAVVMDMSRYKMLYGLSLTKDQQEKIQQKVEKTIQVLHDAGFVHGDVRSTNILIDLESLDSDDVRIHFVDFDWAGRIGEAKYPNDINGITVKRPEGAEGGKVITMEHDKMMVSYLFT
jgi:hypothetical protein